MFTLGRSKITGGGMLVSKISDQCVVFFKKMSCFTVSTPVIAVGVKIIAKHVLKG